MHLTCLSVPQCWRWLMIVSRQTALLPVFWSPMISSRWPRPMLVMASMALMPVSSGSLTGWRWTTEGAWSSRARVSSASMSPWPSRGRPRGSTTRPRKPSPTGTDRTRPVCLTSSPSSIPEASPKTTQPISRMSRLRAMPSSPPGNSSSSRAMVEGIPSTRAMPSPVSVTRPTSSRVTLGRNDSTCLRSAAATSSGLMESSVMSCPFALRSRPRSGDAQGLAGLLEAAADAAVEQLVPDADDQRAQDSFVDGCLEQDRLADDPGQDLGQPGPAGLVQLHGGADLGHHPVAAGRGRLGPLLELGVEAVALVQLDQQVDQGGAAVADPALQQVGHQGPLAGHGQPGVGQGRAHRRLLLDQGGHEEQLALELLQLAGPVGAGEGGHGRQGGQQGRELAQGDPLVDGRGGQQLDAGLLQAALAEVAEQGLLGLGGQPGVGQDLAQPHLVHEQAGELLEVGLDLVDGPLAAAGGLVEKPLGVGCQRLVNLDRHRVSPGRRRRPDPPGGYP